MCGWVLHLLSTGVARHDVVVTTFSRAAAHEMRERRLAREMEGCGVWVTTIHGLSYRLLCNFLRVDRLNIMDDAKGAVAAFASRVGVNVAELDPFVRALPLFLRTNNALQTLEEEATAFAKSACGSNMSKRPLASHFYRDVTPRLQYPALLSMASCRCWCDC